MAMLDETELRLVFRKRLKTVAGIPDDSRIAWENREFEPPNLRAGPGPALLWIRELVRILSETKSSSGFIEAIGETMYLVETPRNQGTEQADALARLIAEAFQAGQSLTGTSVAIILEHTERRPYLTDPDHPAWTYKTVVTRWRTFTQAETL